MTFLLVVTVSSLLLAAIMSVIAWRIAAQERRRSEARVEALAAEIHAPAAAARSARVATFQSRPSRAWNDDLQIRPPGQDLFIQQDRPASRFGVVAALGAVVAAAAVAFVVMLERPSTSLGTSPSTSLGTSPSTPLGTGPSTPLGTNSSGTSRAAEAPAVVPTLELIALGHDRDGDRLTVRGVVRNPAGGATVEQVAAVVLAFGADGGFLGTGRAIIESTALHGGADSPFVVSVPNAGSVARYRVSFRSGDGVVPHVDLRVPGKVSP